MLRPASRRASQQSAHRRAALLAVRPDPGRTARPRPYRPGPRPYGPDPAAYDYPPGPAPHGPPTGHPRPALRQPGPTAAPRPDQGPHQPAPPARPVRARPVRARPVRARPVRAGPYEQARTSRPVRRPTSLAADGPTTPTAGLPPAGAATAAAPEPKGRRRRIRRLLRRPTVRVILALIAVFCCWLAFSVGQALAAPNGGSLSSKLAEWARDHYLGPVVTFGEWLSYSAAQGGRQAVLLPRGAVRPPRPGTSTSRASSRSSRSG